MSPAWRWHILEEICSLIARLPWHHEAGDESVPVRNTLFTVCKQLSIHQRQRHSVALVTAQGPTPSYVIQQDLMGQKCVIINGTWVHKGACDEFSPLMRFTSFPRPRCSKMNWQTEEYGGGKKMWERSCKDKGGGTKRSSSSRLALLLPTSSCGEALVPLVMCHNKEWWRTADAFTPGHNPSYVPAVNAAPGLLPRVMAQWMEVH